MGQRGEAGEGRSQWPLMRWRRAAGGGLAAQVGSVRQLQKRGRRAVVRLRVRIYIAALGSDLYGYMNRVRFDGMGSGVG